jgi:hypothetical protein
MTDFFIGTPDTIRTYDLLYRKQTLYPAELRVLSNETNLRFFSSRRQNGIHFVWLLFSLGGK